MTQLFPSSIWKKIARRHDWANRGPMHKWSGRLGFGNGLPRIETTVEEVDEVARALEKRFLATGTVIVSITPKGEAFIQLSSKLLAAATGQGHGSSLFFESMGTVEPPLNFLSNSHEKTLELLQRLRQANERINEFANIQADLERAIAPLKYLQTLFKIESAPLGPNIQNVFGALTQEIEALHDQMRELFATKIHELLGIQKVISEVVSKLQAQTDTLGQSIVQERVTIEQSIKTLQQELIENKNREPRISGLSKAVNNQILEVVVGLQYQDIVNQKLQHTVSALGKIREHCRSGNENEILRQMCLLEAHQLQATRKDLSGAEQVVKTGVQNILNQLVRADDKCVSLDEFKQLTISSDGMVQVILDALETLRQQISATVTHSVDAFEKLRPLRGLASDVTVVIRELSQRMHLIGLNAQLRAVQVDQGNALEILSARTSEISRETIRISEIVAAHLDELVRSLAEAVSQLEQLQGDALRQQESLARAGAETDRKLHDLRDETLSTQTQLFSLIEGMRNESEALVAGADYVSVADPALAKLEKEFQAIADSAAILAEADSARPPSAQLQEFEKSYTMASEREVFDRVIKGETFARLGTPSSGLELFDDPPSVSAAPAPIAASKINEEDLGFEMFDAPPSADTMGKTPTNEVPPPSKKDTLPMPDPPAAPGKGAPTPPAPPTNYGDNVELF